MCDVPGDVRRLCVVQSSTRNDLVVHIGDTLYLHHMQPGSIATIAWRTVETTDERD